MKKIKTAIITTLIVWAIFLSLFFMSIVDARNIKVKTKDNEVSDINQVAVILEEPRSYMDTSTHTLNSIDLEIHQLLHSLNAITAKLTWWEELREQVLIEAEKVELIEEPEPNALPE